MTNYIFFFEKITTNDLQRKIKYLFMWFNQEMEKMNRKVTAWEEVTREFNCVQSAER